MTHLTTPPETDRMPKGVPYIVGNEGAERFSFYGMKAILMVFMTQYMINALGKPDTLNEEQASAIYHYFTASVYFFPILGALIADIFLGKYRVILWLSIVYCLGHGLLALMDLGPYTGLWDMKPFLYGGLILIAIGSGGIKPCVSAHVGDQFGKKNQRLIPLVFNLFYFSINLGSAASMLLIPWTLNKWGAGWAFGVPGILMAIATIVFWMGRHVFVHVPPCGLKAYVSEISHPASVRAISSLAPLFLVFIPFFWSIFEQTGSRWVLQSLALDRQIAGFEILPSQLQALNPFLVMGLIPLFMFVIYPALGKLIKLTPLRKIGIGIGLTAAVCGISAWIEVLIAKQSAIVTPAFTQALTDAGVTEVAEANSFSKLVQLAQNAGWTATEIQVYTSQMPSIGWQCIAYLLVTMAEILVSVVCLEFAYTQSPPKLKSTILGIYLLGVSLGNFITAGINNAMDLSPSFKEKLDGANYYLFFGGILILCTIGFAFFARYGYKGRTWVAGESVEDAEAIHQESIAEGTSEH